MKKILLIILVCIVFVGCDSVDFNLRDNQIGFSISGISFVGDWSSAQSQNVKRMNVEINLKDTSNTSVKLNMNMTYNDKIIPKVHVPDGKYVLNGNGVWNDTNELLVKTNFIKETTTDTSVYKSEENQITVSNEYYHELELKYNAVNNSVVDITITNQKWNLVPKGLNFDVNSEVVHDGTADGSKLNLIVMAEGYRADQMDDYKAYVADAFKSPADFHELDENDKHITNDFFARYWNQIRVIRMDTISPEEGVDTESGVDKVQSILNYSIEGRRNSCDFDRIKVIINRNTPLNLSLNKIDAVIILVNDKTCWAYTWAYGNELGLKFGQPIHPIIIQAPVGADVNSEYFHKEKSYNDMNPKVITYAIAHELGHALARLQDEYINPKNADRVYFSKYRNVDNEKNNKKWQKLIDAGYGGGNENNHFIGEFEGGMYKQKGIYRPTQNSTMKEDSAVDIQFDPVNTYHLVASLKIRLGLFGCVEDLQCDEDPNHYEWQHYSIEDFKQEWPPEMFNNKQ